MAAVEPLEPESSMNREDLYDALVGVCQQVGITTEATYDVRGYTWGWVHEIHTRNWSFRYASAAMPRVANGLRFDRRLLRNRGDVFEGEYRYELRKHPGVARVLNYENHANAGTYAEALRQAAASNAIPEVTATRRNGTLKYGFGVNA